MTNTVLIPVDFSDASATAARTGVEIARRQGARVELVHVFPEPLEGMVAVEPMYLPPILTERLDRRHRVALTRRLDALRDELGRDPEAPEIRIGLYRGNPAEEIVRLAALADLVVLGATGGHWIGGVAETLIREGGCAVLAIPAAEPGEPPWAGFQRALVAVADADETEPVARLAGELAGDDATIELIYAWGKDYPHAVDVALGGSKGESGAIERGRGEQARALEEFAASLDLGVSTRGYLASGPPAAALLARADEIDADLVAVGAHRPDDENGPPQGIAEHLLRHAHCAVLALPVP